MNVLQMYTVLTIRITIIFRLTDLSLEKAQALFYWEATKGLYFENSKVHK